MLFPLVDENPTRRFPVVTVGLIAVNTLLLLATIGFSAVEHNRLFIRYGFVPERLTSALTTHENVVVDLRELLGDDPRTREVLERSRLDTRIVLSGSLPAVAATIFTSMFLHAGFAHLVGNMWFLWIFGNNVEDRLGHVPYLLFYLVGGVFAVLAHWSATTGLGAMLPTVGASGAVAVVLGAYAVTYPTAQIRCLLFVFIIFLFVDLPAVAVLGVWMLGQIVEGLGALHLDIDGGVAWWAHIGGFVFGMAVMPLLSLLIPDTTYQSVLTQERAFQFDPRRHDDFRS
ncbi:rhomboid family intramembrane serine protease [Blastopirellula marina]|uniref:Rhomboid family intramembrane serine protease n=1 Tax=Blastopirellula marina TaxID=124 RepID=A0A2S8F861_9BACT|nr:rhomboid family intramembrane serine protease [Blastopirellula marina]PQO28346.1 rhomboid family intramembrane serine protease [Blastopirellula marina]PTL41886.1 rhomboid family intramembrane serine protease [Blastopirellula marina]